MKSLKNHQFKSESGQGTVEYILLIAIVVWFSTLVYPFFRDGAFTEKLTAPIKKEFAKTYQYGSPKVVGYEEGDGPRYHPRATFPEGNFRIFINPVFQGRGQ